MKPSNILSLCLFLTTLFGMFYTNNVLKGEFLKIDLDDKFKNYISHDIGPYSVLSIAGSNGYPIDIKGGIRDDVKVLRSRLKHFKQKRVGDTLFIEFAGTNISVEQALSNNTPPGIIVEKNKLSSIIVSHTYNRISGFSGQKLDIKLKNASITDIADSNLQSLSLTSEDNSQYVFSKNNRIDSLNITMLDKSIGRLDDIDYVAMNHTLEDSITLVLSKKTFDKIQG